MRYPEETKKKAIQLRLRSRTKWTLAAIGEELGVSTRTLRSWFRAAEESNSKYRGKLLGSQPRTHDRKRILNDLKAKTSDGEPKFSRREIGAKYGCSQKFLSDLANGKLKP
jgi:transposase-like protein